MPDHDLTDAWFSGLVASIEAFAAEQRRRSPLCAALAAEVARQPELIALFGVTPPAQRRPVLFLAALHDLVLAHPDAPISACFPTVTGAPAAPDRAAELLLDAARDWAEPLTERMATRATQTNEVGRAAAIAPGLAAVARGVDQPLHLIELGASAGLLLCTDRYRVRFGDRLALGPADSPVRVDCEIRHRAPDGIGTAPEIAGRIGVDLDPVDLLDPERARWLLACVWADDVGRFARLKAAIELVRHDPPAVRRGDAADELPRLLDDVPAGHHPVIVNSWALTYLTPGDRTRVVDTISRAGRDLSWLSFEQPRETPELPRPATPLHEERATDLVLTTMRDAHAEVRRLAELHPHGHWIEWTDPMPSALSG